MRPRWPDRATKGHRRVRPAHRWVERRCNSAPGVVTGNDERSFASVSPAAPGQPGAVQKRQAVGTEQGPFGLGGSPSSSVSLLLLARSASALDPGVLPLRR